MQKGTQSLDAKMMIGKANSAAADDVFIEGCISVKTHVATCRVRNSISSILTLTNAWDGCNVMRLFEQAQCLNIM